MSEIRVNNITNREGSAGPSVAGIPVVDSTSHFVVPTGRTGQRYADGGENIVRDGLVLYLDAKYSYPSKTGITSTTDSLDTDVYTWYDMSGNESHGQLDRSPKYDTTDGGSLFLNNTPQGSSSTGDADHINIQHQQVLPESSESPFTLEAWTKVTGVSGWQTIISLGPSGTQMAFQNATIRMGRNGGGGVHNTVTNFTASANTWYHVVMTYDGNWSVGADKVYVYQYINGVSYEDPGPPTSRNSNADMGRNGSNNGPRFAIGGHAINTYPQIGELMQGYVSQVRIYNRPLTAAEVLQNYNATKSRYGY